jgi:hypothetical protein
MTPPTKTFEAPAMLVNSAASAPAVTDSATDKVNFFLPRSLIIDLEITWLLTSSMPF